MRPPSAAQKPFLTDIKERLRPAVIQTLGDPFLAASFGNAVFTTQTRQLFVVKDIGTCDT